MGEFMQPPISPRCFFSRSRGEQKGLAQKEVQILPPLGAARVPKKTVDPTHLVPRCSGWILDADVAALLPVKKLGWGLTDLAGAGGVQIQPIQPTFGWVWLEIGPIWMVFGVKIP